MPISQRSKTARRNLAQSSNPRIGEERNVQSPLLIGLRKGESAELINVSVKLGRQREHIIESLTTWGRIRRSSISMKINGRKASRQRRGASPDHQERTSLTWTEIRVGED